jgi:glycosyltransferase involved in cell wall biosynthesis
VKKLGILVGEDNWMFFHEIYDDLAVKYRTEVYKKKIFKTPILAARLNRWTFLRKIQTMLRHNEVCFFEWASELLMVASHLPKRCAIVTRLHSFELYDWAPNINWDAVDKVILVSRAMQKKFVELYPDHGQKAVVVYNGISTQRFKPSKCKKSNFNLGMLCSIKPVKRVYEVILVYSKLVELGYTAHLHIGGEPDIGDFRYAAAVYGLVEKLNLENNVTFHGHVGNTPAWLQQIDIFISNSFWEGQQVALLEAMASGCFCLSHFWDGAEEILPPENLYITDAELLNKLIQYFRRTDDKEVARIKLRSIICERFDIEYTKVQIGMAIEDANADWLSKVGVP